MAYEITCDKCSNRFNPNNHYSCPKCKTKPTLEEGYFYIRGMDEIAKTDIAESYNNLELNEKLQLEAQNRTTLAVRSLAISFVAAPVILILLAIAICLAASSGRIELVILILLIATVISLYILFSALDSLRRSRIPEYFT